MRWDVERDFPSAPASLEIGNLCLLRCVCVDGFSVRDGAADQLVEARPFSSVLAGMLSWLLQLRDESMFPSVFVPTAPLDPPAPSVCVVPLMS